MSSTTGTILHLQRLSTEDGPGIRTTVFFKGCPLRCRWCHNPESISSRPQLQQLNARCIGCGSCLEVCPNGALTISGNGIQRDRGVCQVCGTCVEACPAAAQEMLGRQIEADFLVQELKKDLSFFDKSGGGVTLSGGEPTRQPEFARSVAAGLRAAGVSVALDTCGMCAWDDLEALLPEIDWVLFDLKFIDLEQHRIWTGGSNAVILDNFHRLMTALPQRYLETGLWVRTPLIPGATATEANLTAIGRFLAEELKLWLSTESRAADLRPSEPGPGSDCFRWELLAFNNLCRDKYTRLGYEWEFADTPLLTRAELDRVGEWAVASGVDPRLIRVTGASRQE